MLQQCNFPIIKFCSKINLYVAKVELLSLIHILSSFEHLMSIQEKIDILMKYNWKSFIESGEQGWRSDESTHLPPMWPGFDSRTRHHTWVEFVVGSRSCSEGCSPVFLPPQKPTLANSNSIRNPTATSLLVARPLCSNLINQRPFFWPLVDSFFLLLVINIVFIY